MSANIQIEIRLFGAFRDFDESGTILINVSEEVTVLNLKKALMLSLSKKRNLGVDVEALLKFSVLATEQNVLKDADIIKLSSFGPKMTIAILPPVCGG